MRFLVFALLLAASLLGGLATEDVEFGRTRHTLWATLVLLMPAAALYILGRPAWRSWWGWSYAAYLGHFWYGFVEGFGGDVGAVYDQQGGLVATTNFVLTALWGVSVVLAWREQAPRGAAWIHPAAMVLTLVSAFVSTVVLTEGIALALGVVLTLVVLVAIAIRFARPRQIEQS